MRGLGSRGSRRLIFGKSFVDRDCDRIKLSRIFHAHIKLSDDCSAAAALRLLLQKGQMYECAALILWFVALNDSSDICIDACRSETIARFQSTPLCKFTSDQCRISTTQPRLHRSWIDSPSLIACKCFWRHSAKCHDIQRRTAIRYHDLDRCDRIDPRYFTNFILVILRKLARKWAETILSIDHKGGVLRCALGRTFDTFTGRIDCAEKKNRDGNASNHERAPCRSSQEPAPSERHNSTH